MENVITIENIVEREAKLRKREEIIDEGEKLFNSSEFSKHFSNLTECFREIAESYSIKDIKPIRLKVKDPNHYTSKIWHVDNPRYFLLRAAVEMGGPAPFSAIRRSAVNLALDFYGNDDTWNKNEFLQCIRNLESHTLKEFCRHNRNFGLRINVDREWSVWMLDPDFSFKEYEEMELRRLKDLNGKIKNINTLNIVETQPDPEENYVSPEIDWDAIERAAKLEFDPDK